MAAQRQAAADRRPVATLVQNRRRRIQGHETFPQPCAAVPALGVAERPAAPTRTGDGGVAIDRHYVCHPVQVDDALDAAAFRNVTLRNLSGTNRRLPISLFAETPQSEQKQLSKNYAPFGRLIPCELIVTVDSSSIQTPIIGLVTEDIYHNGRLIIPAGTEVHGKAQTDRTRERIASGNNWTLVWTGGEELRLSGIALDREADPGGDGWGITDGSAGLRGRVLKSDDLAEIKLFAATFLSGAASAFTQTQPTIYGNQITPTLQNAPLTGAQSVINAYAQQILDSIQRDGFYVRVPAGKQFYLYVTQTIDESDAVIGGTRVTPNDFASETNQPAANSRRDLPPEAAAYLKRAMP